MKRNYYLVLFVLIMMATSLLSTDEASKVVLPDDPDKVYGNDKEKEYFKNNANKKGIVSLKNGLQYKILKSGSGDVFSKGQNADVHYEGRLIDGTVFDSSYKRKQTYNVTYKGPVIKGWQEILTLMKEGDQWEVYIPSKLAYGSRGAGGTIKPNATLIFKMEVVKINKK